MNLIFSTMNTYINALKFNVKQYHQYNKADFHNHQMKLSNRKERLQEMESRRIETMLFDVMNFFSGTMPDIFNRETVSINWGKNAQQKDK